MGATGASCCRERPNALAARVIADLGFKAVYLTGAGLTNMHLGLPDLGFMDLSQVAEHVLAIRGVVDLPLVVDADTGFGNAINVAHTVKTLERAGASAIQLEDQHAPKRCGHFVGKELIPADEMAGKVRATVDARREGMVVIARTDACAVEGFEAAIERAQRYIEAGADMTFVEAPETLEDLKAVPRRLERSATVEHGLGRQDPRHWDGRGRDHHRLRLGALRQCRPAGSDSRHADGSESAEAEWASWTKARSPPSPSASGSSTRPRSTRWRFVTAPARQRRELGGKGARLGSPLASGAARL